MKGMLCLRAKETVWWLMNSLPLSLCRCLTGKGTESKISSRAPRGSDPSADIPQQICHIVSVHAENMDKFIKYLALQFPSSLAISPAVGRNDGHTIGHLVYSLWKRCHHGLFSFLLGSMDSPWWSSISHAPSLTNLILSKHPSFE